MDRREWLQRSRLYLICDTRPEGRDVAELLRGALKGGVDVVQLRDKAASDHEIVRAGRTFRRLCDAYDALFIVNDRPDLAVACGADGVHVGQDDARIAEVRDFVGPDYLIGVSTHARAQVDAVEGADYFAVGPVYATPTKPTYKPVGLDLVSYAAEHAKVPFFAIGGIDPSNVGDVLTAGAPRVAVVRAIAEAADPTEAARLLSMERVR